MALTKKDRQDVVAMIERTVRVLVPASKAPAFIDPQDVEEAAQNSGIKIMTNVESISIRTGLKPVAGETSPGSGTTMGVKIKGTVDGNVTKE